MDIIALAAKALAPISKRGISVKQGWYDEKLQKTHITLWNLTDTDEGHCDDAAELTEAYLQVNIWGTYDAVDLKKEVKKLLTNAGFDYQEGQDVEEKPGLYNKAMRFYMMDESEE
ncbi:hypothetical protein [Phascolarctobacterium sp.]|uniref:hypothetical protein n=1 Tax=Phascolarctobacterium sp. TaxID=2049039 RepID=UPI003866CD6F